MFNFAFIPFDNSLTLFDESTLNLASNSKYFLLFHVLNEFLNILSKKETLTFEGRQFSSKTTPIFSFSSSVNSSLFLENICISPLFLKINESIHFIIVVLPLPLPPINPTIIPLGISKEIEFNLKLL